METLEYKADNINQVTYKEDKKNKKDKVGNIEGK
jgi:hypothetical protein